MTAEDSLRFLAYEAQRCRDRDAHEALGLRLPATLKVLGLAPMSAVEAASFDVAFHEALRARMRGRQEVPA